MMDAWQTIETAPKDGENVLLWNPRWECPVIAFWDDNWDDHFWHHLDNILSDIDGEAENPTHWLRYSTPPADL